MAHSSDIFNDRFKEWKETGTIKYVKWHKVNDDFVCDICKSRAEKEFLLNEIEIFYPGCDDCRCWFTPIVNLDLVNQQTEELWNDVDFDD